eukprot:scaffold32008_cov63-Phaeocystis_antarctica.AAC.6
MVDHEARALLESGLGVAAVWKAEEAPQRGRAVRLALRSRMQLPLFIGPVARGLAQRRAAAAHRASRARRTYSITATWSARTSRLTLAAGRRTPRWVGRADWRPPLGRARLRFGGSLRAWIDEAL